MAQPTSQSDKPRRAKRTPEELAAYHREQARKNDVRYATATNPDVRLADSIIRKLVHLGSLVDDVRIREAIEYMEAVRTGIIDETLAASKPQEGG